MQDVIRLDAYVNGLEEMTSQERFELVLDEDWNGAKEHEIVSLDGEVSIEETGVHIGQVNQDEQAALRRFLQQRPISQDQTYQIQYPKVDPNPINEFTEDGYVVKAFPGLFPTGQADLVYTKKRPIKVTPVDYFRHLVRYRDGRFSSDPRFLFFALNTRYRSQLGSTARFFIQKGHFETMTVKNLREEISNPLNNLAQRVCRYATYIPGLAPFWYQKRAEVSAIARSQCPHVFATFSAADTHWVDFHRLVEEHKAHIVGGPVISIQDLPPRQAILRRNENLQMYPQLASEFLHQRFNLFLDTIAYAHPTMKVHDHWFRYEWQFRGSGHLHGFLWIDHAPNLSNIILDNSGNRLLIETFWNQDRVRVDTPYKGLYPAPIHPCQYNLPLTNDLQQDLSFLVNRVQKHTCGSYCLRKKRKQAANDTSLVCRFHFPLPVSKETKISKDSDGRWHLNLYRTEADIDTNRYNPLYLQAWRANTDFQPILSLHAVLKYIAKYATKAETASSNLQQLLKIAATKCDDDSSVQLLFKRMLFTFAVERDFSAQEASHILQGLPLVLSSWKVISLNLSELALVPLNPHMLQENDDQTSLPKGILEKYISRDQELKELNLDQLLRFYHYRQGQWYPLHSIDAKKRVIRCIPDPPMDILNPTFCRVCILRYIPFQSLWELAGIPNGEEIQLDAVDWVARFKYFLNQLPLDVQSMVYPRGLEGGVLDDGHDSDLEIQIDDQQASMEIEDWMDIAGIRPKEVDKILGGEKDISDISSMLRFLGHRQQDISHNWNSDLDVYGGVEYISDGIQWIKRLKDTDFHASIPFLNPETLNIDQRKAFDMIMHHFSTPNASQLLLLVSGTAGSGKSYLINVLRSTIASALPPNQSIEEVVSVLAYTGCAAHNIDGSTIHGVLQLGFHNEIDELQPAKLMALQNRCQHMRLVIIDEKSMIGQHFLSRIDRRLSLIFPKPTGVLFGGLHVVLMGDFAQLPPVMDTPLYIQGKANRKGNITTIMQQDRGYFLYRQFTTYIQLTINMRQEGESSDQQVFREMLSRARNGLWTVADWTYLQERVLKDMSVGAKDEFVNAITLMCTRQEVKLYNAQQILAMKAPVYRVVARHNAAPTILSAVKQLSSDQGGELSPYLLLSIGARVMITKNLWVRAGIVNGSIGILRGILLNTEQVQHDFPLCLLVELHQYCGPLFIPSHPKIIPVPPFHANFQFKGQSCTRIQFPVVLAWALTIHKSQGMTLDKAIIDLGIKEYQSGLTFVAISRVKALKDLAFLNRFSLNRLTCIATHRNTADRLKEEERLKLLNTI